MTFDLHDSFLDDLIDKLDLQQKVQLLTGRDFWTTWPIESIGLRSMLVSDGPSGVRGEAWDERDPSLNLPSATCLSSSWDPAIARRYGNVAAVEARRKGVDVVLGPTVNIHRSPLGGRHFEAFSEDPRLTADLCAAYVDGLQENGVGATPKHYVANDAETERMTASSEVSERALREVYLLAFERAVTEANTWLIMSAYNSINGTTASEHDLLETPLNSEWGFDGVVISDWTAVRSIEAAKASQDLAMPGPDGPWGQALVDAVQAGEVDEAAIDRKIRRLLLLAARVGALTGHRAEVPEPGEVEDGVAFAREAAIEGTVLLSNKGLLPLDPGPIRRIAVIGHNAVQARTQGGGSATVLPESIVTPLDGIRAAFPRAEVTHSLGAVVQDGVAGFPLDQMTNPVTGTPGARARFLDADGRELFAEDRLSTALVYLGGDAPIETAAAVEVSVTWTPAESGVVLVGFAAIGTATIEVDGTLVGEKTAVLPPGGDFAAALLGPPSASVPVEVTAGVPIDVRVTLDLTKRERRLGSAFALTVGSEPDRSAPDQLIVDAAAAAAEADLAIVVVGTNSDVESEGHDRTDLALPGRQDEMMEAVLATGTPTVAVVNSGSPVEMPWRHDADALLLSWFGGQQMGEALADVMIGAAEPGGHLPTTWPAALADCPVADTTPVDGAVRYTEGIHVGYRAWLKAGTEPAYPFGFGLGYTTWLLSDPEVAAAPAIAGHRDAVIGCTLTNTGERAGKQVVQVYLSRADSDVDRPVRWLAAHTVVRLDSGEHRRISLEVPLRAFAHWDHGWSYEPGTYTVAVGTSVVDLPLTTTVELSD